MSDEAATLRAQVQVLQKLLMDSRNAELQARFDLMMAQAAPRSDIPSSPVPAP